jgi:hypothetical protein
VYRLTEDMIVEFLPPGVEGGVSYCCEYKRPGVDSGTAHMLKDSATVHEFFDFLSGLEEFMQKQSWGRLATSKLPSHYVGLIIFISAIGISHLGVQFQKRFHKGESNCHCPDKGAREEFGNL